MTARIFLENRLAYRTDLVHGLLGIYSILFVLLVAFSSAPAQENLILVVKKVKPAAVVILTYDNAGRIQRQGSGFFINQRGYFITSRHMLQDASRADVKTAEGKVYPIQRIIAEDEEWDLIMASTHVPSDALHYLSVSGSVPEVGERIMVVGCPMGLEQTVSDGIVSAVREIPDLGKMIQITAPISPGSSGGPVVNMKAQVVGVATLQAIEGQNLNFAVPSSRILMLPQSTGQTFAEWVAAREEKNVAMAESLYMLGLVATIKSREEAIAYYQAAIRLNPGHVRVYRQIGDCYFDLKRYKDAIEAYQRVITLYEERKVHDPHYTILWAESDHKSHAYFFMGWSYQNLGRLAEAAHAYKQTIRVLPNWKTPYERLSGCYLFDKRYEKAINVLKQAIEFFKADADTLGIANLHYKLAITYGFVAYREDIADYCTKKIEELQQVAYLCKEIIGRSPDNREAHLLLGEVYSEMDEIPSALQEWGILKELGDSKSADYLLSLINLQKGLK